MTHPFIPETIALAKQCFDRFTDMHDGRELTRETKCADLEAFMLVRTGFSLAIRDAQRDGNEALAAHIGELLNSVRREDAYAWLDGLAAYGDERKEEV